MATPFLSGAASGFLSRQGIVFLSGAAIGFLSRQVIGFLSGDAKASGFMPKNIIDVPPQPPIQGEQITDLGPTGWADLNDWSSTWTCWDNFGMLGGPSSASNS